MPDLSSCLKFRWFVWLAAALPLVSASSSGAALFVSFQAGDLRVGPALGVSTDGTLVNSNYAVAATTLNSDQPGTAQNGLGLRVGTSNAPVYRSLIAFDVSYLTNVVGSNLQRVDMVALRLTHPTNSGAGLSCCSTHGVFATSPFDETSATWNAPHGPGSTVGGDFVTGLRNLYVTVAATTNRVETWGSPTSFWGTEAGSGPDLLVEAVRTALTNSPRTIYLMVKRNTEQTNAYFADYVDDDDARVDLRPELLVGIDSVAAATPIVCFEDNFNGTELDTNVWSILSSRPNVSVTNGNLALTTVAVGTNWQEGFVSTPVYAGKYGYYETRMKVNGANGLNNAFWLNSPSDLSGANNPVDRLEIDIAEAHHQHNDNHMTVHDWAPIYANTGGTVSIPSISSGFAVVALDWRPDNTLVWYWNGEVKLTKSASTFLGFNSMIPLSVLFSTKVIPFAGTPGPGLEGSQMLVDYVRVTQRPGWGGGFSGDWNNPFNWGLDGIPATGHAAIFNQPAANTTITLTNDIFCHSLYFDNPGCSPFVFAAGGGSLRLGSAPAGVGGITINTTVTNSQTINANITAERQLQFGNFSRTPTATLFLNGSVTAVPNNTILQFAGYALVEVVGALSSKIGKVTKWAPNTVRFSGTNDHTGLTEIHLGALVVASPAALGTTASGTVVSNGATLAFASGVQYNSAEPLTLAGNGHDGWSGAVDLEGNGAASFSGPITLSNDVTLGCSSATGTLTLSGNIGGTNAVQKSGDGLLVLGGSNSFVGLEVNAGAVLATNAAALGAASGTVFIHNTAQVRLGSGITKSNLIQFEGATPGVIHLLSSGGTNQVNGLVGLMGGGFDYGISVAAGRLTLAGGIAFTDIFSSTRNVRLSGEGEGAVTGPIQNGGSATVAIIKEGAGQWTLAGTNSHTSATTVTAGTLLLNGTSVSAVTVSGGIFGGSGVISNRVTISAGSHVPGSPVGVQTVWSNYVVSAGGTLKINVNGTNVGTQYSQVAVRAGNSGTVTLSGALNVAAVPGLATNTTFVIIDNDGTDMVSGTFAGLANNATFFQSGYTWRISYVGGTGNDVTLTIVAASQPAIGAHWSPPSLVLSWPDWAFAYSLFSTTNLAPPTGWSPVTNVPVLGGGKWSVTLPASSSGNQFFRLISQ
jgi:autotransporter-associated beta strand protein